MNHPRPWHRNWLVLCVPVMIGGCINMAPQHEAPALPVAQDYAEEDQPQGVSDPLALHWQDYFADPRLKGLIETAFAANRDLVAATARIDQARARYRIQDSQRLPAPEIAGSSTRTRSGSDGFGALPGGAGSGDPITFNRHEVGVAVTGFELDFWGRVANLSEAARAEYLATDAAQRAFRLSLIGEVAQTYFALIEAQEQIALAQATARSREEGLRIAQVRLDAGVTSALPYRQAETLLTQAQQQLKTQHLAAAQARNQLIVLVGGHVPEGLPEGLDLDSQQLAQNLDAGLPSRLLLARPDIMAAEERLRGARASIGAARAAFFPSISLTGSAGFASTDLGALFDDGGFRWSVGPALRLPIFNWGALKGDLNLARAREVEAVALYDLAVQQAFREVSDALAGRRWLDGQVQTLSRAVDAQAAIARLAQLRYREGVADYLEVLDAERNLFTARQNLLAARRNAFQNAVSLYIALGGGAQD